MLVALRLSRVAFHILVGLDAAVGLAGLPKIARERFLRWWARAFLGALGVRLRATGAHDKREPALVVANHISWLDVIAITAISPAFFVCKSEVAAWPAAGWLLRRLRTIFIRRGSLRDVLRVNNELRARFASGDCVAAFPEGTTTHGHDVLPFRGALFQPVVERGVPVLPIAIAYSSDAAAYVGGTSLMQSLLAIVRVRDLEVRIAMLPALQTRGASRREVAARARHSIRDALGDLRS